MTHPVVVIGAGLAGLCCGRRLAQCGVPFVILEASDGVGGRVRTDVVDGFRLDRGFQIFLPGYPEARRVLDYTALDLRPFTRGALVRWNGKFHRVADPRAEPLAAVRSLVGPVGGPLDKFRIPPFFWHIEKDELEAPTAPEVTTLDLFRHDGGFSDVFVDRLVRPFLGGVMLEKDLATSSRFARFVLRVFAAGAGAVPALGMGAIPQQIADALPAGSVRLNSPVMDVGDRFVTLTDGERIEAKAVVVATDGSAAARLTGGAVPDPGWNGSATLYYGAPRAPVDEPILMLNAHPGSDWRVNSVAVLSAASPEYAPPGQSLISVSLVGVQGSAEKDDPRPTPQELAEISLDYPGFTPNRFTLEMKVRGDLFNWFGDQVRDWRLLRIDRIPHSLPKMPVGSLTPWRRPVQVRDGVFVCGDHRDNGSIDGAMSSGFRAAQAVMEAVGSSPTR